MATQDNDTLPTSDTSVAKKAATKKSANKQAVKKASKTATKKTVAKKAVAKKTATKKTVAKKTVAKKTVAKKASATKTAGRPASSDNQSTNTNSNNEQASSSSTKRTPQDHLFVFLQALDQATRQGKDALEEVKKALETGKDYLEERVEDLVAEASDKFDDVLFDAKCYAKQAKAQARQYNKVASNFVKDNEEAVKIVGGVVVAAILAKIFLRR